MPLRLKIDPGSKTTGLAAVNDATGQVVWAAELSHRGQQVKERLDQRRACRDPVGVATLAIARRVISTVDGALGGSHPPWRAGSPMW